MRVQIVQMFRRAKGTDAFIDGVVPKIAPPEHASNFHFSDSLRGS